MNKESAKRTFIVRTVAAILAIYVIVLGSVTYQSAKQKRMDGITQVSQTLEAMSYQFNGCKSQVKSKAVVDGLNLVKADSVMKEADDRLGMWDARKRKNSLILYKEVKDKEGNVTGLKRVRSDARILYDPNTGLQSSEKVVLDDWFDKKTVALLADKYVEENSYTFKGFQNSEFFEPTSLNGEYTAYNPKTDGRDTHKLDLKTGHKKEGYKEKTLHLENVYVEPVDAKSWQEEDETWKRLEKLATEFTLEGDEEDGASKPQILQSSRMDLVVTESTGFKALNIGDYWLGYCVVDHPLVNGIYSMLWVYFIATVIFVLIGLVLIGSYCRVIDTQYETEERRRKMSDAMAHEMKTPLSIIKNYSEVLSEEKDEDKRKRYLNTIIEETDDMNHMIVSMLDLSKMEAGTYPLELSVFFMKSVVEQVVSRTKILRERKNLQVNIDYEEKDKILADKKLLTQSICNLMLNAIAHAEENSTILIRVKESEDTARFEILNRGKPVARKDQNKIWDSFYRGEGTKDRVKGGNGLGLSIVKNACILHQGTCGFENKKDGVEFWVEIPSQEGLKAQSKECIGPILNTEKNGIDLSGLVYAVVGAVIWLIPDTFFFLLLDEDSAAQNTLLVLIGIIGWALCLIGTYKLNKNKKMFKLAYLAISVSTLSIVGYCVFLMKESPLIVTAFQLLMLAGIVAYLTDMSLGCRIIMKKFGKKRLSDYMLACLIAWLLSTALCAFFIPFCPGSVLGPAFGGLCFIVALVNLWFWYDTFKRFHGKE